MAGERARLANGAEADFIYLGDLGITGNGRNTWSAPITKLDAYIEIDRTGERFRVQLNTSGIPTDLAKFDPIAAQGKIGVVALFTQDTDYSAWKGLEPNAFISRYTPFTFVVSINGGEERRYSFSTEQCREKIQAFIDASLKPLP